MVGAALKLPPKQGQPIIRVHDAPAGHDNLLAQRGERDYALVNGRPKLIAKRTEFSVPSQVAGLSLEEVQSSDGQWKELVFDIDQDGQQDVISLRLLAKVGCSELHRRCFQCKHNG